MIAVSKDNNFATLEAIGDLLRAKLEAKNDARDMALRHSRSLVRKCAITIRAVHRGEMQTARVLLRTAEETAIELRAAVDEGWLTNIPGLGSKTVTSIWRHLDARERGEVGGV